MSARNLPRAGRELASLVDALLDAPPERRAALIAELGGGDPAAARSSSARRGMRAGAGDAQPAGARSVFAALFEEESRPFPESLAERYRVTRELGRGGMATRLSRPRPQARARCRGQGGAAGRGVGVRRATGSSARSRSSARLRHPAHRPALRLGRSRRRRSTSSCRSRRGRRCGDRLARDGPLAGGRRGADPARRLRRAGARARARHRPPRHQARQRAALRPARDGRRFRRREGGDRCDAAGAIGRSPRPESPSARRPTWRPSRSPAIRDVDHRADIYAVGVLALRAACGRAAVHGRDTPQEILRRT